MSSHHIIREDQEPALIVDDLAALPPAYLDQLLEWNPTLLTGDGALKPLLELGINVDVWFTQSETTDLPQRNIILKPLDAGFIETALDYLLEHNFKAVNIVSKNPEIPRIMLKYADRINPVLFGNGRRIAVVKPGFSKWKPGGAEVWLYCDRAALITHGLIHQHQNEYLTQADGFFSVEFASSFGLVGEQL